MRALPTGTKGKSFCSGDCREQPSREAVQSAGAPRRAGACPCCSSCVLPRGGWHSQAALLLPGAAGADCRRCLHITSLCINAASG